MKRLISILLTAIMLLSLTVPALAAPIKTSGAASTLKLESVTGTAQLKNASGKDVKVAKGTRLYNGTLGLVNITLEQRSSSEETTYGQAIFINPDYIGQDEATGEPVFADCRVEISNSSVTGIEFGIYKILPGGFGTNETACIYINKVPYAYSGWFPDNEVNWVEDQNAKSLNEEDQIVVYGSLANIGYGFED